MSQRWRPSASREVLLARAELLAGLRRSMAVRGILEIDAPLCSSAATPEPSLDSMRVEQGWDGAPSRYLATSPEYPLKRLLAAGYGDVYCLSHVFRSEPAGRRHNPEFCMLEWYRTGIDHLQLADEVVAIIGEVCGRSLDHTRISYRDAFLGSVGIDPTEADVQALRRVLEKGSVAVPETDDRRELLDLVFASLVQPPLGRDGASTVFGFPADQAALARVVPGDPPTASRFETFLDGIELANGFHELTDAAEQARRFEGENSRRDPPMPVDQHLLDALAAGLPDCAGVALGVDRLLMWMLGESAIERVLPFDWDRA